MPDYNEAVERGARWLYERHNSGDCDCAEPTWCLFEAGYKAAISERGLTAAGANESQGDDFDYKRWGQERHQLVESLRAENERLRIAGAKIQEAAEKKGARLSKGNEQLEADYEELVIQAAKERGILNAEQSENERLREALEKIVRWDDAEKPHKNIPLLDCANLARRTLSTPTNRKDAE